MTFQLVLMTDGQSTYAVFNYGENNLLPENYVKRPVSMAWQCSVRSYENLMSLSTNIYKETFYGTNDIANGDIGTVNTIILPRLFELSSFVIVAVAFVFIVMQNIAHNSKNYYRYQHLTKCNFKTSDKILKAFLWSYVPFN